ncbi:stalk domain-containing protein [Cellulosilyticum ruminicola]
MKLRQKLAVVLASAMVVSAVPVVTMAASTNSLTKETLKVKKEAKFYETATANAVRVKFTDHTGGKEVFYLDLENAKWNEDVLNAAVAAGELTKVDSGYQFTSGTATITYERQNDDTVKVTVEGLPTTNDSIVQLPLLVETKDGDAKVTVVSRGGSTTVTQGTFVFATTAEKKISVTAKDDKTFYTSGELSEITIEEAYTGALDVEGGATFTIEIDDSDFYFTGEFKAEYKYGFSGKTEEITADVLDKDNGILKIKIPRIKGDSRGTIVLKNIKVRSSNRKPSEGDFLVDIKGDDLVAEKTNLKVGKVSQYGIYIKAKDDKAKDVKAGRKEEIEFEIGENVENSMITNREFEMTLDNGHWDYKQLVKDAYDAGKLEAKYVSKITTSSSAKVEFKDGEDDDYKKAALRIDKAWLAKKILDNTGDWAVLGSTKTDDICLAEFDEDDDKAVVETIIFTIGADDEGKAVQNNTDCDKLKFKTKICVPVDKQDKEKVEIKITGRGIENESSATLINIINPFKVTFEQAVLKTGKQGQVTGSVTITETDKDMLQKGDVTFKIKKDDEDFGIYLKDVKVEVSDGLKGTKSDVTKGKAKDNAKVKLTLNRTSKEAATITFKDMTFTTDRTVPEGTYDLEIGGKAIDADDHTITVKDFIKISTANTEEITSSGLAKGVAKFVIGEKKYTLNDKEVEMDAPSYIQDGGYTMVPVRYVANAFGVAPSNIMASKGTATIFAGERTINLTSGSNVAVVNGNQIKMATKVVNKDGRLYVPAGQIANLLGIKTSWDNSTKTATFENK